MIYFNKLKHTRGHQQKKQAYTYKSTKSRKLTSTQWGTGETLAEDKLYKNQVYYKHFKEYI